MAERSLYAAYVMRFKSIPPLTQKEEYELGRRIIEEGDEEARKAIIERHIPLVLKVVSSTTRDVQKRDEFIAEGILGLFEALERWEITRNNRFATYAHWWIRSAIGRARRAEAMVQSNYGQQEHAVVRANATLTRRHRHAPTPEAVAAHTGISVVRVQTSLHRIRARETISFETPVQGGKQDSSTTLGELLQNQTIASPDLLVLARDELAALHKKLETTVSDLETKVANERSRNVFKLYYGLEEGGDLTRRSLEEVSVLYSVSRERIRQIIAGVWDLIDPKRELLANERIHPFEALRERIGLLEEILAAQER